ncbi:VapE domain-containing protein [uncultured Microscilla sp.]|uniref:VapE domain-containing protein n=1 Tax=uncultured Microscilla sp. TaxID=432653 RepID=UPI002604B057|nr:VapE domain-containing protein [uncultured Microscilla sp.]
MIEQINGVLQSQSKFQLGLIYDKLVKTPGITIAKKYLGRRYDIRLNTILNSLEYSTKDENDFVQLNENDLYVELHEKKIPCGSENLKALLKSSYVVEYNPLKAYFEGLPKWEQGGKDYIGELAGYITTNDQERWLKHFKKHLVRSIACTLSDDVFNKQCLTLTSSQNDGKSTFCRFLCPPQLNDHITDNPSTDKDGEIALTENFIINLDELSGLSRADINALKSYFTRKNVNVRRPYAATTSRSKRVANFVGSTNDSEFLTDPTGSVRWLCFEVQAINFDYSKKVDINLVWAQAFALLKNGFDYQLSKEDVKENEEINKKYQITTPEMELVAKAMKPLKPEDFSEQNSDHQRKTATQILDILESEAKGQRLSVNRLGKAMRYYKFVQKMARVEDKSIPVKVWYFEWNRGGVFNSIDKKNEEPKLNADGYLASGDKRRQGDIFKD